MVGIDRLIAHSESLSSGKLNANLIDGAVDNRLWGWQAALTQLVAQEFQIGERVFGTGGRRDLRLATLQSLACGGVIVRVERYLLVGFTLTMRILLVELSRAELGGS